MIDLFVDGANFALERLRRRARVMRAQRSAQLVDHALDRRKQSREGAAVAACRDALGEIADRALDADDRVPRGQIGEAARHRRQLGAQRFDFDARRLAPFARFAAEFIEPLAEFAYLDLQAFGRGGARRDFGDNRRPGRVADLMPWRAWPHRRRRCCRRVNAEIAPARLRRFASGDRSASVELLATARDLADGVDDIETRTHYGARYFGSRFFACLNAARQFVHALVERARGLFDALLNLVRWLDSLRGEARLGLGDALFDRVEAVGDGIKRLAFFAAAVVTAFDPCRDGT